MDFSFTKEEQDLREEIEAFVKDTLPPDWDDQAVYWPGSYGTMPQVETQYREMIPDEAAYGVSCGDPAEHCPACGEPLSEGAFECVSCGLVFGGGVAMCTACGAPVPPEADACPACGAAFAHE